MNAPINRPSGFYSRVIDFIVLTVSFLLLALVTDFAKSTQIFIDLSFYVFIMYFSLRLCKHLIFKKIRTYGPILTTMLGNVLGLIMGAISILTFNHFFPGLAESALVVIFSSVLAFFILGTLSPMVKSSNKDILHQ